MSDNNKTPETIEPNPPANHKKVLCIRTREWTEWLPMSPDESTEAQLAFPQGVTFFEIDEGERVLDINVNSPGVEIKKKVKQTKDDGTEHEIEHPFALYAYQVTTLAATDLEEVPPKFVTAQIPAQPKVNVAQTMPVPPPTNRAKRRGR
jgi:hypothetical protein